MGLANSVRLSHFSAVHDSSGCRLANLSHPPYCSSSNLQHADSGAKLLILEHSLSVRLVNRGHAAAGDIDTSTEPQHLQQLAGGKRGEALHPGTVRDVEGSQGNACRQGQ